MCCCDQISPGSKGLFSKAIMESNPSGFRYRSVDDMKLYGQGFCDILNCNTSSSCNISCIQAASLTDVAYAWNKVGNDWLAIVFGNWDHWLGAFLDMTPVVDGVVVSQSFAVRCQSSRFQQQYLLFCVCQIPADPYSVWTSGEYNAVPMLLGVNNNEGQTFLYEVDEIPAVLFQVANVLLFGSDNGDKVNNYYADLITGELDDGRPFMSQVLTDFWFRCASEQWATSALKKGVPAYFYRYSHILSDSSVFARFGLPAICANVVSSGC